MNSHTNRSGSAISAAALGMRLRRFSLVLLTLCAVLLCTAARLEASIVTYRFSGNRYFSTGTFPGGTPTNFSGTVAYDTSTPATSGGWPDQRTYLHAAPLGPSGLSITTDTGGTFATDPNTTDVTYSVDTSIAGGPTLSPDSLRAGAAARLAPAGWTNGYTEFQITGNRYLNQSFMNFSTALPSSLPTFNSLATRPPDISNVVVLIEANAPGTGFTRFRGQVTSLQHVSTASETSVTSTGSPITTTLDGGAGSLGGVTVGFTPSTTGTFEKVYNTVATDELPAGEPFTAGNFILSVPGETLQYWDLHYTGALDGPATVSFQFDPTLVTAGLPLGIWHYVDATGWEFLGGNVAGNTITVTTDSFSPFALGVAPVPEPSAYVLGLIALAGLVAVRRKSRRKGRVG